MQQQIKFTAEYRSGSDFTGIPVWLTGILQVVLGVIVISIDSRELLGLISGLLLLSVGLGLVYVGKISGSQNRVLSRLLLKEDRVIFEHMDGIHTVYWTSVVGISLREGKGREHFLTTAVIIYEDYTCSGIRNEHGQVVVEQKLLEIPLILFRRTTEIIKQLELVAKHINVPFSTANLEHDLL